MKKICYSAFLALGVLAASCGGTDKPTPEDEVREYGRYFVEKLAAGQLDSVKGTYPDIASADSIAPLKADTIIAVETAPGQYDVTLAKGVVLKATRSEEGDIRVASSRGLFAFPAGKVELARKTGLWADSLSDKELAERMRDDEFFKYVNETNKGKLKKLLSIGRAPSYHGGNQKVTNNSDKTIDGADYKIVKSFTTRGDYFSRGGKSYSTVKGKTLKPGESAGFYVEVALMGWECLESIKWQLPEDKLIAKYVTFTGNEYEEYLKGKK